MLVKSLNYIFLLDTRIIVQSVASGLILSSLTLIKMDD